MNRYLLTGATIAALAIPSLGLAATAHADKPENPGQGHDPVTICHVEGNGGSHTIVVDNSSVLDAHLRHGDSLGACAVTPPTETPTENPTEEPTEEPTEVPTETPTETPTDTPTDGETGGPGETPTVPEPTVPEPTVPVPTVPEPTQPEPPLPTCGEGSEMSAGGSCIPTPEPEKPETERPEKPEPTKPAISKPDVPTPDSDEPIKVRADKPRPTTVLPNTGAEENLALGSLAGLLILLGSALMRRGWSRG